MKSFEERFTSACESIGEMHKEMAEATKKVIAEFPEYGNKDDLVKEIALAQCRAMNRNIAKTILGMDVKNERK